MKNVYGCKTLQGILDMKPEHDEKMILEPSESDKNYILADVEATTAWMNMYMKGDK